MLNNENKTLCVFGGSKAKETVIITCTNAASYVYIKNHELIGGLKYPKNTMFFSIEVNGVLYNADKKLNLFDIPELTSMLSISGDSGGTIYININDGGEYKIKLSPSAEQKVYSDAFGDNNTNPSSIKSPLGDFYFCLKTEV